MAKLHIRGKGNGRCNPRSAREILAPGDAAAIYEAYLAGTGCSYCDFKNAVEKMRQENAMAVRDDLTRLGIWTEMRITMPIGDTTLMLEPADPDARMIRLDAEQVKLLIDGFYDVMRIMSAREAIEKRTSQPECIEEGCHDTPIGWLQMGYSERVKTNTHEERALTTAELRRCEGHQGRAAA